MASLSATSISRKLQPQMSFSFSFKKGTQALNFFANEAGGSIDKLKVLKLLYFADRFHLRKHGRAITNDTYFAMRLGPVASGMKDLADGLFLADEEREYAEQYLEKPITNVVSSRKAVDYAVLSKSDLDALHAIWKGLGHFNGSQLVDLSHEYPEWKQHEAQLRINGISRVKMDYKDFLDNPKSDVDPQYPLSEQERLDRVETLEEAASVDRLWR
jgi:uncharacterized phage-associated protein